MTIMTSPNVKHEADIRSTTGTGHVGPRLGSADQRPFTQGTATANSARLREVDQPALNNRHGVKKTLASEPDKPVYSPLPRAERMDHSTLSHNPLASELEDRAADLKRLHRQRSTLASSLQWYSAFNRAESKKEAIDLEDRRNDAERELSAIRDLMAATAEEISVIRAKTGAGRDPRYWFSKARARAKHELATHTSRLAVLETSHAELVRRLKRLRSKLKRLTSALAKYERFDQPVVDAELVSVDTDLLRLQSEHDVLADRSRRLDENLESAVDNLSDLEAKLEGATMRHDTLNSGEALCRRHIEEAGRLDQQLSKASNSHDRWEVHRKCEDRFGVSSPREVMKEYRNKLKNLQTEINTLDRRIPAIRRDINKVKQRIATIVVRGTRDIRSIVVDGNNLCYQDAKWIGIAALQPLCQRLQEGYEVTLIFDASIRRLLSSTADSRYWITKDHLREQFPDITVHVVAARTQADETILAAAADSGGVVITNDRFSEYRDKPAVRENRLLTHEILNSRILVHDLDIDIAFGPHQWSLDS